MTAVYDRETTVVLSRCDNGLRLGIPQTFQLCMDLAGAHAEELGNGVPAMLDRGLFWVAVKTRLRFFRRPGLLERVVARTWPEPPGRMRQDRDYLVTAGEEVLIAGKTEWTILDTKKGGLHPPGEDIYPAGMEFCREKALPEPFHRFLTPFPEKPFARYTVRSTDIDAGGHMNNAQYARMVADLFSVEEWTALDPAALELHYRAPCYEGDTLLLRRHESGDGLELQAALEDGKVILLALLTGRSGG